MGEEHAIYRVLPRHDGVKVYLTWTGHHGIAGELIDLSVRHASVAMSFPASDVPALPIGSGVFLSFEIQGRPRISSVLALVRYERTMNHDRILGFEIADWRAFLLKLPPELFALFNRRRNERVSLPAEPPITVDVTYRRTVESALLLNISAGGCLLALPASRPDIGDELGLEFQLPDSTYQYDLTGVVRSVHDKFDSRHCGVEFVYAKASDAAVQQRGISIYVMKRQRETAKP